MFPFQQKYQVFRKSKHVFDLFFIFYGVLPGFSLKTDTQQMAVDSVRSMFRSKLSIIYLASLVPGTEPQTQRLKRVPLSKIFRIPG